MHWVLVVAESLSTRRRNCLERGGTSDDVDELVGDGSLATTVVLHLQRGDHVAGILGRVVHGVTTRALLSGMALDESGEDGVGKLELCEVLGDVFLHLVALEARRLGKSLGIENLNEGRLVGKSRDESVVDDNDRVVLYTRGSDEVGDCCSISEGGDVLANLVEGKGNVAGNCARKLHLGLVTDDHNRRVRVGSRKLLLRNGFCYAECTASGL